MYKSDNRRVWDGIMGLEIEPVSLSGINLYTENDVLVIKGKIDTSSPGDIMRPFLMEVHNQALAKNIKNIKVDIKELSYLNSSAISELSDWLLTLEELPDNKKYTIDIFCNLNKYEWQYSTMKTLQLLSPDFIKLH